MKPRVYLETTVVSYLTAWPGRDLVRAAHQQVTVEWWQTRRDDYELVISQFVLDEASVGDPDAASARLTALDDLPIIELTEEATSLAEKLLRELSIPERAAVDAFHIAIAAVNGIDYLLTWNCTHIANAAFVSRIEAVCRAQGLRPPVICTPEQLMGE